MNVLQGATRVVVRAADTTASAAGAVGGAAINGVVGGVQGTVAGLRTGLSNGSNSTPAAALTLAAIGAAGLVEWPVLLAVGGTVLAVRQLNQRSAQHAGAVAAEPTRKGRTSTAGKKAPATPRKAAARSRRASTSR